MPRPRRDPGKPHSTRKQKGGFHYADDIEKNLPPEPQSHFPTFNDPYVFYDWEKQHEAFVKLFLDSNITVEQLWRDCPFTREDLAYFEDVEFDYEQHQFIFVCKESWDAWDDDMELSSQSDYYWKEIKEENSGRRVPFSLNATAWQEFSTSLGNAYDTTRIPSIVYRFD